jgi:flagellar hook-associated protein 1 FlgK
MAGVLGISLSGLLASQQALETTGHNIANVNTNGYSRQRVDMQPKESQFSGDGFVGQGVTASISRVYDKLVSDQLVSSTSTFSESAIFSGLATQVDNLVSNESTNLSPSLKSFFNAANNVANDPSSLPVRQIMIAQADSIAQKFNSMSNQLEDISKQTNARISNAVDEINAYAQNIASLNDKISLEYSRSNTGQLPNDLMDQRDLLISKIAEKVNVSSLPQTDGGVNVFMANGQSLVLGKNASDLSVNITGNDGLNIAIDIDGQDITQQISSGELSGIIQFKEQILTPAKQNVGLLAAGFAVKLNEMHQAGFDLQGKPGQDLFSVNSPQVVPSSNTVGAISVSYDAASINQLMPSDYELSYDGVQFSLTRLTDNTVTTFQNQPPTTIEGPGFKIDASDTTLSAGDSFLIQPTLKAAGTFKSIISDPLMIAASSDPDTLPGNNQNALTMANAENLTFLLNGRTTFNDLNGNFIAQIGSQTNAAKINDAAQEALFNAAKSSKEGFSGVNLDEEAANLIKYKQSYEAAAQAISVSNSLFDTLIQATKG